MTVNPLRKTSSNEGKVRDKKSISKFSWKGRALDKAFKVSNFAIFPT